jgi:hypothetical protein
VIVVIVGVAAVLATIAIVVYIFASPNTAGLLSNLLDVQVTGVYTGRRDLLNWIFVPNAVLAGLEKEPKKRHSCLI